MTLGCGYVFIDDGCYSLDYNARGKFWQLIRVELNVAACYHGSGEELATKSRAILAGEDVLAQAKVKETKEEHDARYREVNAVLERNRK